MRNTKATVVSLSLAYRCKITGALSVFRHYETSSCGNLFIYLTENFLIAFYVLDTMHLLTKYTSCPGVVDCSICGEREAGAFGWVLPLGSELCPGTLRVEVLTLVLRSTARGVDFHYSGCYCLAYLSMSRFLQLLGVLTSEDSCQCPSLGTICCFLLVSTLISGQPVSRDVDVTKAGHPLLNLGQLWRTILTPGCSTKQLSYLGHIVWQPLRHEKCLSGEDCEESMVSRNRILTV